ncbi:hypothetical protein N9544_00185 [Flavobacteriales bacterium]|nr:hypothetical protein [Flavobacteriales bacterium]
MKRNILSFTLSLFICNVYSQVVSQKTTNIVNSIKTINEIRFDDVNQNGLKSPQYFNYIKMLDNATKDELLHFANDSNEIVKGYVYLALLERQDKDLESFYIRSVQNEEKVISNNNDVYTEILLYDFLRSKVYDKINSSGYNASKDTFYNKLNSNFDSILIMNYTWDESDVFMDHIIESISEDKEVISNRKRWLSNSFFEHKIAKEGDDYLFGRMCGYPATMPYLRGILEKSIQDTLLDRIEYFDRWISCDILVVKVYGAEALIRLHNQGKELTPIQTRIITDFKSSFKSVQMCMDYYRERKSIKFALKDYELKSYSTQ